MTGFWDGRPDGRSDLTPNPAFAFGDAGKNCGWDFSLCERSGHVPSQSILMTIIFISRSFGVSIRYQILGLFGFSIRTKHYQRKQQLWKSYLLFQLY